MFTRAVSSERDSIIPRWQTSALGGQCSRQRRNAADSSVDTDLPVNAFHPDVITSYDSSFESLLGNLSRLSARKIAGGGSSPTSSMSNSRIMFAIRPNSGEAGLHHSLQ